MWEKALPSSSVLYDIQALLPWCEPGTVFFTPNERMARAIEQAYHQHQLKQGRQAWQPLVVRSLNQAMQRWVMEYDLVEPLTQDELLYFWQVAIEADAQQQTDFSWLSSAQVAREAYQTDELIDHFLLDEGAHFEHLMSAELDSAAFLRWRGSVREALGARKLSSSSQAWVALNRVTPIRQKRAVLVDFQTLTPLQRGVLKRFFEALVDCDSTSQQQQAQAITLLAFPEANQAFNEVAKQIAALHRADPEARIALVAPQLQRDREQIDYHLRSAFGVLDDTYTALPVNFSAGVAAVDVPLISAAVQVLKLLNGDLLPRELIALLHSPFLTLTASPQEARSLRKIIASLSPRQLSLDDLTAICELLSARMPKARFAAFWSRYARFSFQSRPLYEHVSTWTEVLEACGWPGSRVIDSVEYQAQALWTRVLRGLVRWDRIEPQWPQRVALTHLQQALQRTVFQPETPTYSVQVLGTLEASGLFFDHVFVLDCSVERFPETVSLSPYLPRIMQRSHQLPRTCPDREYELASELLWGFTYRAHSVTFLYVDTADEQKVQPTPILASLTPRLPSSLVSDSHVDTSKLSWESLDDTYGIPLAVDDKRRRVGSYHLAYQAQCPFKGYTSLRLRAEPYESLVDGLSPMEQGSLTHKAFEFMWLNASSPSDITTEMMGQAVVQALNTLSSQRQRVLADVALVAEKERLTTILTESLNFDLNRSPFRVLSHETPMAWSVDGITVNMRVDRIESLADGAIAIVDYKSSAPKTASWFEGRLEQPQLPLYSLAMGERVGAALFAEASVNKPYALKGVAQQEVHKGVKVVDDWPDLVSRWEEEAGMLARELITGFAAVTPSHSGCDYCSYASICRIADASGAGDSDE